MPRSLALAAAALLALPATALAGPPWVSIELPANPLDRTTRGAYLLVHSFHHERAITMNIAGRAEGLVNGKRTSVPLTFRETSRGAVLALDQSWPKGEAWVLVITTGAVNGKGGATAIVGVGPDGEVRSVKVPNRKQGEWIVPTEPAAQEIERQLQTLAGLDGGPKVHLGFLPLVLLPLGVVALRRR